MDDKASCVSVGGGGAEPSTDADLPPVECLGDCWIGGVGGGKGVTLPGFGGLTMGAVASPRSDSDEETRTVGECSSDACSSPSPSGDWNSSAIAGGSVSPGGGRTLVDVSKEVAKEETSESSSL